MKVPKLRFNEFNGEWNYVFLNSIVNRITRKNLHNESNLSLTISAQYGLIDQLKFFNKNVSSNNLTNYYLLFNGDFAYNKSYSNGYPWGTIKKLKLFKKGVVSSLYICFKNTSKVNDNFLEQYFETSKWHKPISLISVEGARNHGLLNISVNDFFESKHYIPKLEEQEKIANFLNLLDEKIQLQQRKIEALKIYKKGLLYNTFSKNPTNCKIKDLLLLGKSGGTPKSTNPDYYNGTIPFLSITDMTIQGKYINQTEKHITDMGLKNSSSWLLPVNTLILSMYASYGILSINKIPLSTSQAMFNMIFKQDIDSEYMYYYLNYLKNSHFYEELVSTGTQSNLNADKVKNIPVYLPSKSKQYNISTLFNFLDKKIELQENNLNHLFILKKGLLQQMFI